jgi:hypothetical protein
MTFAESVLRLVLGAAPATRAADDRPTAAVAEPEPDRLAEVNVPAPTISTEYAAMPADAEAQAAGSEPYPAEPGFADLEAAVALVHSGVATRVIVAGFPSWPGLLWRAYRLAEEANVLILPTVVRPGGRVDIVVVRDRPDE